MAHKIHGTTRLLEETAGNTIIAEKIATAERIAGLLTGVRHSHDGQILVTVKLSPEVAFFGTPSDFGGRPLGAPQPMTPEMFAGTWGLMDTPLPKTPLPASERPEGRFLVREQTVAVNERVITPEGEQTITGIGKPFAISKVKHARLLESQPHTDIQVGDRVAYAYYSAPAPANENAESRLTA